MKLELNLFNKKELIRAASLLGYSNKNDKLNKFTVQKLKEMILAKANPKGINIRKHYEETLDFFKVEYNYSVNDDELKRILFEHNCKKMEEAVKKMSKKKKKKLTQQMEQTIDPDTIYMLKKQSRRSGAVGGGILALQGGAILITGSNLGICMLLTSGLSTISSIVGITFPFAAYTTAAVVGGKIIAVGSFLANPFVAIPILGITGYTIYRKQRNKKYINLASINYLIESKKLLEQ